MLNNTYAGIRFSEILLNKKPYSLNYIEYSKDEKLNIKHHTNTNQIGLYLAENIFFNNKSLYDSNGDVIVEYDRLTKEKTYDKSAKNFIAKKDDSIYIFIEPRTKNYFHFYAQTVTALHIIKNKYKSEKNFIWVVGKLNSWKKEILNILNVNLSSVLEIDLTESYCFEEIFISSLNLNLIDRINGTNWAISNPECYGFKDEILNKEDKSNDSLELTYEKKIYLSRSQIISHRNLKNENEVENIVKQLGYKVIYPEKLSIIEQAKVFNNAEVILGATGAAFTNIIFCKQGTKIGVIQVTDIKDKEGGYAIMASLLGLKSYFYNAEFDFDNKVRKGVHDDYKVNTKLVKEFIIGIESDFDESILKNVTLKGFYREFQELPNEEIKQSFSSLNKINNNHQPADILREVAICFEKDGDVKTASNIMKKALELRPFGSLIKIKLEEYNILISKRENHDKF